MGAPHFGGVGGRFRVHEGGTRYRKVFFRDSGENSREGSNSISESGSRESTPLKN